ncbi:hypothetical protein GTY84_21600 [Streptomyces sp. SID8352]|nr:hypothetical protein [Streptomyces sp. SID8352]
MVGVGGDARVTGLWRHGENRPLPLLHKMVDSGNQGYASRGRKVRPGGSTSRKSHDGARFIAGNGGKQPGFRVWRECESGTRRGVVAASHLITRVRQRG